jgi:hypothetical protein
MVPAPRTMAGLHASYYVATGVWPLVHRSSFERVVGRKEDFWLARTVGGLAAAIGLSLGLAAIRGQKDRETVALALASAAVFAAADIRAALTESRVYLGDTVAQIVFAPAWLARWDEAAS